MKLKTKFENGDALNCGKCLKNGRGYQNQWALYVYNAKKGPAKFVCANCGHIQLRILKSIRKKRKK